ncbi:MAG: flagellar biosynthesis protein FlhA [Erysipelotrichales bacterium]|nr:flagellar biosynthesis protein FlhA [Erysipelotrichales bacterium]
MKYIKLLGENFVSVMMAVVVLMIIIPLPKSVLDLLFVFNIGLSFLILLMSMNITEALQFSIYPSLLLITTIFRLGLNVSSTRSILSNQGDAGKIIQTFGEFVIQGNVFIGLIIFLIIVIVNFMVITKGSERVAEVTARFTLDAMPGKQMAIDADLSAGIIDETEAKNRRQKIQRESDFFGAMDGASKFVKGDSIVSLITTAINLIGGIIMGFMQNVGTFGEIVNIYSIATVGDGLVGQLPSLLISVATGMIVTRSASEASMNKELIRTFTSQPKVLILTGIIICCLALIPGMPLAQILMIGGTFIALGVVLLRKDNESVELAAAAAGATPMDSDMPTEEIQSETSYYKNIDNVYKLLNVEQIEMEVGYSLIPIIDEKSGGSLIDRIVMFRKQFAQEMGIVVPSVHLKDSAGINPNQYVINLKGEEVARGDILVGYYLAIPSGEMDDSIPGIETREPAFGLPAKWVTEDLRIKAEIAGYTLIDPTSVIVTHFSEIIKQHAYELVTRQELNTMVDNLKKTNPNLVSDLIPNIVNMATLQKIVCNLLKENIPVRDLATIIETIGDYALSVKDLDVLTEYVRQALKRTISHRFADAGQLKVLTLDQNIENMIMQSVKKVDNGSYLALEPANIQLILNATKNEVEKVKDLLQYTIVLTAPIARIYYKKLVDQFYPNLIVLSFNEVEGDIQIQALGNISLRK